MSEKKNVHYLRTPQAADKTHNLHEEDEVGTGGNAGGTTEMRWVDPLAGPTRDDLLAPQEKERLRQVHEFANKLLIDKQKLTIQERKLMKEGVRPAAQQGQSKGLGSGRGGSGSRYKEHPIAKKFAGKIDKQLSPLATENEADTNAELKEQLENKLQNRYQNTPKFNPRPRPPG